MGKITTAAKRQPKELHVNMDNRLTRMAHGLTLGEKRLVCLCLAMLDSVRVDQGLVFKVSAVEYAEHFGISPEMAYVQMKEAGDRLLHRVAKEVRESRKGKVIDQWPWMGRAQYFEGQGYIELSFNPIMRPFLTLLRGKFTSYKLVQASALRSVYSWRLLELLMQFKHKGVLNIEVDELAHALEAPESARKNFGEMRRRIIAPAVKEIIDQGDLLIEWGVKTQGRKTTHVVFKFKRNPQTRLDLAA